MLPPARGWTRNGRRTGSPPVKRLYAQAQRLYARTASRCACRLLPAALRRACARTVASSMLSVHGASRPRGMAADTRPPRPHPPNQPDNHVPRSFTARRTSMTACRPTSRHSCTSASTSLLPHCSQPAAAVCPPLPRPPLPRPLLPRPLRCCGAACDCIAHNHEVLVSVSCASDGF